MGSNKLLNEALNQALKLQAVKAAARPPMSGKKDHSPYGNMVATSQVPQEWMTCMLAVRECQSSKKRMLAET
jgi:hypothetical protein